MQDLVKRLREAEKHDAYFFPLMRSAADEIEKLTAELKTIEERTLERAAVLCDERESPNLYKVRECAAAIREMKAT